MPATVAARTGDLGREEAAEAVADDEDAALIDVGARGEQLEGGERVVDGLVFDRDVVREGVAIRVRALVVAKDSDA